MAQPKINSTFRTYGKAIVGFIAPGVVALVAAVQDGSPGGSTITGPEWVAIGAACILTSAGVYAAPYRRVSPVDPAPKDGAL